MRTTDTASVTLRQEIAKGVPGSRFNGSRLVAERNSGSLAFGLGGTVFAQPLNGEPDNLEPSRGNPFRGESSVCSRSFTLLELLATALLTAILLTSIVGVWRGVHTIRERCDKSLTDDARIQHCLNQLSNDLRHMAPPNDELGVGVTGEMDESDGVRRDTLEFVTTTNPPRTKEFGSDAIRVVYELAQGEDGDESWTLVRSVSANLLALEEEDPEDTALLSPISSLELSYYDGESWVDTWDSTLQDGNSPTAVKVRIELAGEAEDEAVLAPELVVAVLARPMADDQPSEQGDAAR